MSATSMAPRTLSSSSTTNGLRQALKSNTGLFRGTKSSSSSSGGGAASSTARSSSACGAASLGENTNEKTAEHHLVASLKQVLDEAARSKQVAARLEEENAHLKQALNNRDSHMLLLEQHRVDMARLLVKKDREVADRELKIATLTAANSQATEQHARQVELLESQAAMHKEAHDQMALAKAALEAINTQLSLEVQALDDQVTACIKSTIGRKYEPGTWADSSDDDPDMDRVAFDIERELHKKEVTALRENVAELRSQLQMGPQHSAYQQGRPQAAETAQRNLRSLLQTAHKQSIDKLSRSQAPRGTYIQAVNAPAASSNPASGTNRAAARYSDDCASSDRLSAWRGSSHNNNNTSGHRRQSSNAGSLGRASSSQHTYSSRRNSSSNSSSSSSFDWSSYEPPVGAAGDCW